MPTYRYFCSNCKETTEIQQKISDPEIKICPNCKQETMARQLPTSFGFQFQGSGFYATDYKQPSSCCGGCGCGCKDKSK